MCVHVLTIDKYYYVFFKCVNKDIIIIQLIKRLIILRKSGHQGGLSYVITHYQCILKPAGKTSKRCFTS